MEVWVEGLVAAGPQIACFMATTLKSEHTSPVI